MLRASGVSELRALGEQSLCVKWYGDAHSILGRNAHEQQTTMVAVDVRGRDDQRGGDMRATMVANARSSGMEDVVRSSRRRRRPRTRLRPQSRSRRKVRLERVHHVGP